MLMDLSKGFSVGRLTRSHRPQPQALDMTKKPEWYHRQPQNCSPDLASPYRTSSLRPDLNQDPGTFMNSPLAPGLDLYRDQVRNNLWHSGFYEQSGDAGPESSGGEEEEEEEDDSDSDSDVIFLVSSAKEPLLCTSFIQDNVTHIVEPLSPAASSMEEGRGFYHLPQTVSSPSRDSSYTEESSDSSMDIPIHHARPIVLLSDLSAVYAEQSPAEASSDDSDVVEVSVSRSKKKTQNDREAEKKPSSKVRRGSRVRRTPCETLPPLTPRRSLRRQVKNNAVGLYNESYDSDDVLDFMARSSSSDESPPPPKNSQRMSSRASNNNPDTDSTTRKKSPSRSPERKEPPQSKTVYTKLIGNKRKSTATVARAKKLRVAKQNGIQSKGNEAPVEVKTVTKRRKKKRKFQQSGPPSMFPNIEPELKLKYGYRKKRERKFDSFSPFVHMGEQTCTVVNYHEEEEAAQSRPAPSQNTSGFVPTTSCYNLGRVSPEFKCDEFLKCCLCDQTANAKRLGDLHGPYYPAASEGAEARTMLNGLHENHAGKEGSEFQNKSLKGDEGLENGTVDLEECWVHEDCGVWSTGVFLVRGKLYGLKEAALLARQTICSCCQQTGAIMGCFQKGCSRNFHFSCAVQSGCVLNEDNFSMRCPDHKNKPCVSRPHLR